jgi:SAM-dependent methyltransferase
VCSGRLGDCRLPGLLQCQRCGFVTADVDVSNAEMQALYGPDYFHGEEYADYIAEEPGLRRNFAARLRTLLTLTAPEARRRLFEIGCAYGFFLAEARPYFCAVGGIDIFREGVLHAREALGLDAVNGDYLEHPLAPDTDVICMWDTIEHLREPHRFIEKAARDLGPGGLLAITTGDIGSLNARLRGRKWRMIHPPTHLHYFSVATLSKLLERHGFTVVHVEHPGVSRTLQSILYITLVVMRGQHKLYDLLKNIPGLAAPVTINLFDIMYVAARKS